MDFMQEFGDETDPRITGEYVRILRETERPVTLVGVVHDHPSSTYRVRRAIEEIDPDVLALELPPISIPLFEQYARSNREPPLFGGEMSAAIQSADSTTVVGIDRPTGRFFGGLLHDLIRERPPLSTVRDVLRNAASTTKHAVVCRIAAAIASRTSIRLEVDFPVIHDTDWSDAPDEQALDERKQVRKSRAFMNAFQTASRSRASQFEDAARERHMADRISELGERGEVVAVVGIDHLDPLAERITTVGRGDRAKTDA